MKGFLLKVEVLVTGYYLQLLVNENPPAQSLNTAPFSVLYQF